MKQIEKAAQIADDHYKLIFECPVKPEPGQFISVKTGMETEPLLRRPFSIFDYKDGKIEIVIKLAGKATSILCENAYWKETNATGPFGKGFTLTSDSKVLLIGGGVGNAPLHYLAKELKVLNNDISYIYGSQTAAKIYCGNDFKTCSDQSYFMTDDGTSGEKGFVTDKTAEIIKSENFDRIYICGPDPMMKALSAMLADYKAETEISLENYFGCGIGICSGCTIKTPTGNKRACVDGPVFNIKDIIL